MCNLNQDLGYLDRGSSGICICCGSVILGKPTLTSEFLARRALRRGIERTTTYRCSDCGFAFHGRGLSTEESSNYYSGYRNDEYFNQRHSYEPLYTRGHHDRLDAHVLSQARCVNLRCYLDNFGVIPEDSSRSFSILDFAGGSGHLIRNLPGTKYVYDLSGVPPISDVVSLSHEQLAVHEFDLVVCAQMLEHASDPRTVIAELMSRVKDGGFLYLEVPYRETWIDLSGTLGMRKLALKLASLNSIIGQFIDMYGTLIRRTTGILPPFAFIPVREHLNFFTPRALAELLHDKPGSLIDASRRKGLGVVLLFRKNGA
jgi:SAM-dependent methyltransferase